MLGHHEVEACFSPQAHVRAWLTFEAELARSQADCGVLDAVIAEQIAAACNVEAIDVPALWEHTRVVGYPILPLVRQIAARLDPPANGRVHYGATTQDVMDTGQALVMCAAIEQLAATLRRLGDSLATKTSAHARTVIAARTHGQQAVPTTFGAKLAVFLHQTTRALEESAHVARAVGVVSLWGAGGTAAALGPRSAEIRLTLARRLGLASADVPQHVDRLDIAAYGAWCARIATLCVRLAREVVDLSRTELGEVSERGGHHYGASSTMPQKSNPIAGEAIIGAGVTATTLAGALHRAGEAGHERGAGEWQVEWTVLPRLSALTGGALAMTAQLVEDLVAHPERMASNLELDHGLVMSEACMITLAESLGRERAHDLVYEAVRRVRTDGGALVERIGEQLDGIADAVVPSPAEYLGEAVAICSSAIARWGVVRAAHDAPRNGEVNA
jgi:3-carboxy-cis,cis-muconate cycloisomerase